MNRLSDRLGLAQQKASLAFLITTFLQKCVLIADSNVHRFLLKLNVKNSVKKNSVKKKFRQTDELSLLMSASKTDIEKGIKEVLDKLS